LIARLERLLGSVETPLRLGEYGVRRSDIPQLALHAYYDPCLATNPRKVTPKEIEAIYEDAF
jgi:alcohol dehydrogenase